MYAIVEIAGQQLKVEKDQQVFVNRLPEKEGSKVEFDQILLLADGSNVSVGAPAVEGATVTAKVIEHLQGDKKIVFKKKRRKGYRVKRGHRQQLTRIEIEGISGKGGSSKKASKPAAEKKSEEPAKKAAPKKEEPKKEAPKKEAPKKEAPKAKAAKDDLTKIGGIGPVFAEKLAEQGYTSFEQISKLTKADIEKLSEAIDGVSEDLVKEEDWKAQAKDLANFQKVIEKVGEAKAADKDDLTKLNGVGPKTEKDLNEIGIYTYEQISKLGAKEMEYLAAISGITKEGIQESEWVKDAKELLKNE